MQRMNLTAGYPDEPKNTMRNVLLPNLPGFMPRDDETLSIVYHGCLIEVQWEGYSRSVALTAAIPGDNGLLTKNVSYLSFPPDDVETITKVAGEMMEKARTGYYMSKP